MRAKIHSVLFAVYLTNLVYAQGAVPWSQCPDGAAITRCQTYDCPKGDTNGDGNCTFEDEKAKIVDSRRDPFCASPSSGCGVVLYFSAVATDACAVLVKENDNNCDLYQVGAPVFTPVPTSTPTPTFSPTPTPTSSPTQNPLASPSPSPSPDSGGVSELPNTGIEAWFGIILIPIGFVGIYLYERFRKKYK